MRFPTVPFEGQVTLTQNGLLVRALNAQLQPHMHVSRWIEVVISSQVY